MLARQETIQDSMNWERVLDSVLVLNASYEPLSVVSIRRAIVLLLKDKAEVLEATEQRIHSAGFSVPVPLVIRLVYYVRVPARMSIPLSRHTVLMRDNYTCQYCGAQPAKSNLTIDHIVPRVRHGATSWENVVCACKPCNQRKGSHLPEEAGMHLLSKPGRPRFVALVVLGPHPVNEVWGKYIPESH
ncbi:MAG: HNH endonuclease [Anaerolineae bacterium]